MCDGSHRAAGKFKPFVVTNETAEAKDYYLCQCGHSKNRPFCDGSHKAVRIVPAVSA